MSNWPRVPLHELGTWFGGGTPSKSKVNFWKNGDIPWLSPKDMKSDVIQKTQMHVTAEAVKYSSVRLVPANAVAVVVRSGILAHSLPVARVPFATTLNQDMKAVIACKDVTPQWIAFGLQGFENKILANTRKAGTTVASIDTSRLMAFELPVPSLDEQRRIVEILEDHFSRIDAGLGITNSVTRKLNILRQKWRQQAVDSAGSPAVTLASLVDRIEAGKSLSGSAPAAEGEWGVIKVSAMTWGEFRPEENKRVSVERANPAYEIHKGDLLLSRANTSAYVGASVLVGDVRSRLLLSDKSLRLIPRPGVDVAWLNEVLQAPRTRAQISASATGTKESMRNISQGALLSIQVPATPLREQRQVLARAREAHNSVGVLEAAVDRTERRAARLRQALLAAAFSGQLTGAASDIERVEELAEAGV